VKHRNQKACGQASLLVFPVRRPETTPKLQSDTGNHKLTRNVLYDVSAVAMLQLSKRCKPLPRPPRLKCIGLSAYSLAVIVVSLLLLPQVFALEIPPYALAIHCLQLPTLATRCDLADRDGPWRPTEQSSADQSTGCALSFKPSPPCGRPGNPRRPKYGPCRAYDLTSHTTAVATYPVWGQKAGKTSPFLTPSRWLPCAMASRRACTGEGSTTNFIRLENAERTQPRIAHA
jgi:hypothetical protein